MILSDFLSRQKHDSNPHEIIPNSFNLQCRLQTRYYNLGEGNPVKYLVKIWSQAKSSDIKLPGVHGVSKRIDPNVQSEKQVIMPIAVTKMKEVSQIKPRLGQGRAGLRCKIKTPIPKSIMQVMEKPIEQPKAIMLETSIIRDKVLPIPNYAIPHVKSKDDSGSKMVERKAIQDISREIPIDPDPVYRPPPKPVKHLYPRFLEAYQILTQKVIHNLKKTCHFKRV